MEGLVACSSVGVVLWRVRFKAISVYTCEIFHFCSTDYFTPLMDQSSKSVFFIYLLSLGCPRIQGTVEVGINRTAPYSFQTEMWFVTMMDCGELPTFRLPWALWTRAAPCLLFPVVCLEKSMNYDCPKEWRGRGEIFWIPSMLLYCFMFYSSSYLHRSISAVL